MGSYFDTIINFYKLDNCRLVIQELSKPCLSRFSLIRLRALKCLRCLSGDITTSTFSVFTASPFIFTPTNTNTVQIYVWPEMVHVQPHANCKPPGMGPYFDTVINFYKLVNFRLFVQELSNPVFQDVHPFA